MTKLPNLTIILLFFALSCSESDPAPGEAVITIKLTDNCMQTRSEDPDEEMVSDVNWFVFNEDGLPELCGYISRRQLLSAGGVVNIQVPVAVGAEYQVYACVNATEDLTDIGSLSELMEKRFWLTYPDDYVVGMPMSGHWSGRITEDGQTVEIPLERMMAKVSLRMDRTDLDDDITMNVRSVEIGNCPRSVLYFGDSAARSSSDVFSSGFIKSYEDADGLNIDESLGMSQEVSVYMLENMQGDLLPDAEEDSDKILSGEYASVCSYIEIKAEYISAAYTTYPSRYLTYRFYLGEGVGNFDIRRNCHYHFVISPDGDGISESSWRVDISELTDV